MADQFVTNYDSLLNSYVLTKYTSTTRRHHANINTDYAFDQIPDSVIAHRLASLHTVIPMTFNQEVRSHIRMYLNRMRNRLDVMLTLSEYYNTLFEESLARYDVPEELKYLTIVESAMNPKATSRVGAAGLWQFMYTTGKNYGLEVNSVIDERRDAYKSSDAAAHYLHDELLKTGKFEEVYDQPFLKEFVLKPLTDVPALQQKLLDGGFFAALQDEDGNVTFCATEKRTKAQIDELVALVKEA
jgi:membrane-bound lytic murein transglycosylase D